VLDHMCIRHSIGDEEAAATIPKLCAEITLLDLGGNLFETWAEVLDLVNLFPKLRSLVLDGNRFVFRDVSGGCEYRAISSSIRELSLSGTLCEPVKVVDATAAFAGLETLSLAKNELKRWDQPGLPHSLKALDLSGNMFSSFQDLNALTSLPRLRTVLLKTNNIGSEKGDRSSPNDLSFNTVSELELRDNQITSWTFFNALSAQFPMMKHLRMAGNPLYRDLRSADDKPLTTEDGYMLTIARLPQLELLNYSKITDKERLNAETYYLGQIASELSLVDDQQRTAVLARHPRYQALCEEYGEPAILTQPRANEIDPNSLEARLVSITFAPSSPSLSAHKQWIEEIPKSLSTYALLGLVGKHLRILPLKLRLVWETGEHDPVKDEGSEAPEWWDSSDEESEAEGGEWVAREVELVPGTRPLGTYMEGREARVRVQVLAGDQGC